MMTPLQAREFADRWLPAWTGNNPEKLAAFYSEDAFYLDPGIPGGVQGKKKILAYFQRLLAQNPEWIWTQLEGIPMKSGFLNKWHATVPVGKKTIELVGVCLVQLDDKDLISRNEVYFDRTNLFLEILKHRANKQN
jgi:hypothetical protein